jgi:hypothetical protein
MADQPNRGNWRRVIRGAIPRMGLNIPVPPGTKPPPAPSNQQSIGSKPPPAPGRQNSAKPAGQK